MFNRKHLYQYGDDPKHVIKLTKAEAASVINAVIRDFDPETKTCWIDTDEFNWRLYNRTANKLNAYIAAHGPVSCSDEWLENHDVLTLIK